jgi:hypothetical protein
MHVCMYVRMYMYEKFRIEVDAVHLAPLQVSIRSLNRRFSTSGFAARV